MRHLSFVALRILPVLGLAYANPIPHGDHDNYNIPWPPPAAPGKTRERQEVGHTEYMRFSKGRTPKHDFEDTEDGDDDAYEVPMRAPVYAENEDDEDDRAMRRKHRVDEGDMEEKWGRDDEEDEGWEGKDDGEEEKDDEEGGDDDNDDDEWRPTGRRVPDGDEMRWSEEDEVEIWEGRDNLMGEEEAEDGEEEEGVQESVEEWAREDVDGDDEESDPEAYEGEKDEEADGGDFVPGARAFGGDQCPRSFTCSMNAFKLCKTCGAQTLSAANGPLKHVLALQKCSPTSPWTIHGLWPNYETRPGNSQFPCLCQGASSFDIKKIAPAVQANLKTMWADCYSGGCGQEYFWRKEWEKHGSCMVEGKIVPGQQEYFNITPTLLDTYKKTGALGRICRDTWTTCNIKVRDDEIAAAKAAMGIKAAAALPVGMTTRPQA